MAATPQADNPPDDNFAVRNAAAFMEKFERYDCQELLACATSHWLLSQDDFKVPTDPPLGLINQMTQSSEYNTVLLMPDEDGIEHLDLREVHQIVRELTVGIFVLNQIPKIALEANFDQSTQCQIPPAYLDTRVGMVMINVDYMLKALWHGAYFPREKRTKFTERWRGSLDINALGKPETKKPLLTEFLSAGMLDMSADPDYTKVYDNLPTDTTGDGEVSEEQRFFMSHVEDLSMQMVMFQRSVKQFKNLFVLEPDWLVSSVVRLNDDRIDHAGYQRLNARLQLHELLIRKNLGNKNAVKKQLFLLKLISFLVPFLVAMKKRMRIPDINKMLPNMSGEELKTERELPPLILGSEFKCKNFTFNNRYFHLHGGIQVDHETPDLGEVSEAVKVKHEDLCLETVNVLSRWLDPSAALQEVYPVPVLQIDGKRYHAFCLQFETYYAQVPQKPRWVHSMCEEVSKLRPKRLPIPDVQIHEQFKKYFGYKKAIKYRNLPQGLKCAAQRGLVAMFQTLCRKCVVSRLGKQDEAGLSYVHYAAMYNRPQIIAILILQSMDVNVRRNNNMMSTGPTPLHLAARCGALEAVSCLVANFANILATDQDGWAPIHHAAFFDHQPVIKLLFRKQEAMLELQTKNDLRSTPLLLAASSGALSALKCLIELGAYVLRRDDEGSNVIHLAAMHFHTNILEFFIQWNHPDVQVWTIIVDMLKSGEPKMKDAAVKCLEVMSTSDSNHWMSILQAGGVQALVELLRLDSEDVQSVAASVLCNISENEPVRRALTKSEAGPILIRLLSSPVDEIQSRAAIILSDLACVDDNQDAIAEQGGIPALINLLDSELEDVLVNAVNAVRVLSSSNPRNQMAVANNGGIEPLVEFLGDSVNSDILQAAASAAVAAVVCNNKPNQDAVVAENAVKPLVQLIKGHNITVQVKAAMALESLADHNASSQKAFLELDAPKALLRLLKMFSMEVKEQAACSLWSLAGQTKMQQRYIADRIAIPQLIEILLRDSEKLQYVGCMGMTALGREDIDSQNRIAEQGGIQPLVRLLRSHKTSTRVLLTTIKALGTLCLGLAHKNNHVTQRRMAEDHAITTLVQLLLAPPSEEIQVEVAYTLGCVVLGHVDNQERMRAEPGFKYGLLLELLDTSSDEMRLKAGFAVAIFAFNNTPQQYAIRQAGGLRYQHFEHFLQSSDEFHRCYAAFQIVVLARVIVDRDQVSLTAQGVTSIIGILNSHDDNAVVTAASLISSLAHTRAGIPDAMVTVGAIDLLLAKLDARHDQVRFHCAVALGYLSYNRTAARLMLTACRNTPGLYEKLITNIGTKPKICKDFTEEFRRARIVGLPCLSLEVNGGPPAVPANKPERRPHTSYGGKQQGLSGVKLRAMSAPAGAHKQQRARSAGPGTSLRSSKNNTPATTATTATDKHKYTFLKTQLTAWEKNSQDKI